MIDQKTNSDLAGLKQGNMEVIRGIYRRNLSIVRSMIGQMGGNSADADDVFQEALETLLVKVDRIESNFDGLLYQICRRRYIDRTRQKQREKVRNKALQRHQEEQHNVSHEINILSEEYDTFQLLDETFKSLSETCQKLMTLVRAGESTDAIMDKMSFSSSNTMYRRKFACIERWSKLIKNHPNYVMNKS